MPKNKLVAVAGTHAAAGMMFALAVIYMGLTTPAAAQALVQSAAGVDFSPLANNLINAFVVVATVAAGILTKFGSSFLASKTKMNDAAFEALIADRLNAILLKAIDYAEIHMKAEVADPKSAIRDVRIDNFFVRTAVDYAIRSAPDIISYFKLTNERIADLIRARLNPYVPAPIADSGSIVAIGMAPPAVVVPVSATGVTGDITAK